MYSTRRRRHTKKQRHTKKHRHTTKCRHTKNHRDTKNHRHTSNCRHRRSKRLRTMSMRRMRMQGGNYALTPAVINPRQGGAYDAGQMPTGKYYTLSDSGVPSGAMDPPVPSGPAQNGGKNNKRMRGGGMFSEFITAIVPEELVNIGRSIPASLGQMSDKFQGVISSPSSQVYPTQQPLVQAIKPLSTPVTMPDILGSYNSANSAVAPI